MADISVPNLNWASFTPIAKPAMDFSFLANLPEAFFAGRDEALKQQARAAVSEALKRGDIPAAAAALAAANPGAGLQGAISNKNAEAMSEYRDQSVIPQDIRMLQWWMQNGGSGVPGTGGQEPMRASPPQPSGTPGVSLQNAPAMLQEKFLPIQEQKSLEAQGTGEGQRTSLRTGLKEASSGVQDLLSNLVGIANSADTGTFENALGPLQGGPDAETWQGALGQFFPQTAGALGNYLEKGQKEGFVDWKTGNIKGPGDLSGGFTGTLRAKVNAAQSSIVNVLQRVLRVPGIGQQSDYELRQIINQVGDLNKSRTKEDFYDRLSSVVSNMKALGLDVEMPESAPGQPSGKQFSERYSNPTSEDAPSYDAAQEAPTAVQGSAAPAPDTGNGIAGRGAPPLPATEDKNKLIYLMNNAPPEIVKQKMEEFDKLYNWPGLASIILGQSRAGR